MPNQVISGKAIQTKTMQIAFKTSNSRRMGNLRMAVLYPTFHPVLARIRDLVPATTTRL